MKFLRITKITQYTKFASLCRGRNVSNVGEVCRYWEKQFLLRDIPESNHSAAYIVAHVLNKKTLFGVNPSQEMNSSQIEKVGELCSLRFQRMPVQYVIGEWDFLDHTFILKPPILIPRPETEELVLRILSTWNPKFNLRFLEVGCGSGVISASLLKALEKASGVAVDCNSAACSLTNLNASKLGVSNRLTVMEHRINADSKEFFLGEKFDMIISNPPYIPSENMKDLPDEIRNFEDHVALDGGPQGLTVIRDILTLASHVLKKDGVLWLEVDDSHSEKLQEILKQQFPYPVLGNMKMEKDFMGISRFCCLVRLEDPT